MIESKKLAQLLDEKVDSFIHKYQSLNSENEMLRDELARTKEILLEKEEALTHRSEGEIKESDIESIIEKLEQTIGNH